MPKDTKISKSDVMGLANLPEPSAMLAKLVPMLSAPDVSMDAVVEEIGRDQALVARILKLVNSSYYHLKSKVGTVRAAVGLLGLASVRQIVYSAVCYSNFSEDERLSWNHAYSCSLLIDSLAKAGNAKNLGCLQLTALLHDLGKLLLRRQYPKRYRLAMERCLAEGLLPHESELEAFGHEHGEIGSWLLESWQMRPDIVVPIASHHAKALPSGLERETAFLQIADWLDNKARGLVRLEPSKESFAAAGLSVEAALQIGKAHSSLVASVDADPSGVFS